MRILLDADTPLQLVSVLQHVLPGHDVHHAHGLRWSTKKDVPLLHDARSARYEVFVTNDANQLEDPAETDAIRKSRLHHVQYRQRQPGLRGLALAVGAVVAAMPSVMEYLASVEERRLIHITGLDPNNRFTSVNPVRDPPRYWR